MPVVKLMGQVYRAVCDRDGCDYRQGGLKREVAEAYMTWHEQEHALTDLAGYIMAGIGYEPASSIKVQIWRHLHDDGHALGRAFFQKRLIAIDARWLGSDRAEDTLRHEIAHFLAWDRDGCGDHGPAWRRAALECGAEPVESKDLTAAEVGLFVRFAYECAEGCLVVSAKRLHIVGKVCARHGATLSPKNPKNL